MYKQLIKLFREHGIVKNHLELLVEAYPDKKWDFWSLSRNPNISIEFITKNINLEWDWSGIAENPNINVDFIIKYQKKFIKSDWRRISKNRGIKLLDILINIHLPWNFNYVSMNPNITFEDMRTRPILPWNYWYASENPNITVDQAMTDPNAGWNWLKLRYDKYIPQHTINYINGIKSGIIIPPYSSEYQYNYELMYTKNLDLVKQHPDLPWDKFKLSHNIKIHPDYPCNLDDLSGNAGITLDTIEQHPNFPCDMMSYNPNLTFEYISSHPGNWDFETLSYNKFSYNKIVAKRICESEIKKKRALLSGLPIMVNHFKYKFGATGYVKAKKSFETFILSNGHEFY